MNSGIEIATKPRLRAWTELAVEPTVHFVVVDGDDGERPNLCDGGAGTIRPSTFRELVSNLSCDLSFFFFETPESAIPMMGGPIFSKGAVI